MSHMKQSISFLLSLDHDRDCDRGPDSGNMVLVLVLLTGDLYYLIN